MAKGNSGFRGQSPDPYAAPTKSLLNSVQLLPAQGLPEVVPNTSSGPPIIAPPNSPPVVAQMQSYQTFKIQPPAPVAPGNDVVDLDLYLDTQFAPTEKESDPEQELMSWNPPPAPEAAPAPTQAPVQETPADALPPGAQRYEVHRFPYDEANTASNQDSSQPQPASPAPTSVYRNIVVRTQSPYQQP